MKRLFIFSLFLSVSVQLRAQSNVPELAVLLTKEALNKNYEVLNSELESQKTEYDIKHTRATYIPKLKALGAYSYFNQNATIDLPSLQTGLPGLTLFEGSESFRLKGRLGLAALNAEMVLFSGMQVEYGVKALSEKKQAQLYLSQAKRNEVTQDVLETLDQIALLHQAGIFLDESQKRLEKEKLRVTKAIENGLAVPYDRKKIEVAVYGLEAKKQEYQGKRELLFSKISMLTGRPAEQLEEQTRSLNTLKPWIFNVPPSLQDSSSASGRPELRAIQSGIEAIDYQIKMQKAKALPQVIALGSIAYTNLHNASVSTPYQLPLSGRELELKTNKFEGFPSYLVGVGLKWQLFSGTQRSHEMSKLMLEKNIAENRKEDADEKLSLLLQSSRIQTRVAEKQMQLKERERAASEDALQTAIKSYQEGLISITDRLEAENALHQSQMDYIEAVFQQRKAALSYLNAQGALQITNL